MSKITAMYIRLSMEDEDVSLNQKEESNSVSSQRKLLESFIGNHSELTLKLLSKEFDVSINTLLGEPRKLICQCCGMPIDDDSILGRDKDGI